MKEILIKGFTILIFLTLILGFVAYKTMDSAKQNYTSENHESIESDSIPVVDSMTKFLIMSSSKSMIIKEQIFDDQNSPRLRVNSQNYELKKFKIIDVEKLKMIKTETIPNDTITTINEN